MVKKVRDMDEAVWITLSPLDVLSDRALGSSTAVRFFLIELTSEIAIFSCSPRAAHNVSRAREGASACGRG